MKTTLILYFILISIFHVSANTQTDSLWAIWHQESNNDTTRINALLNLSKKHYLYYNNDSALICTNLVIDMAEQKNLQKEIARGLLYRSIVMSQIGQSDNAISDATKAEKLFRDNIDEESATNCLNRLGIYYGNQERQKEAIEAYTKALTYYRKVEDHKGEAGCLINTSFLYPLDDIQLKNLASQGIAICREYGYDGYLAVGLGALSSYYYALNDFDQQDKLNQECLTLQRKIGNKRGEIIALSNMANVFKVRKVKDSALFYYNIVIARTKSIYPDLYASSLANKSIILWETGKHKESLNAIYTALDIAEKSKKRDKVITLHKRLAIYLPQIGRHEEALNHYKRYIEVRDSVEADSDADALVKQTYRIEYEKKAIADSILKIEEDKLINAQLEVSKATIAQQKQLTWFLISGIGLVGLFGFFIWQRFRVTNKQKKVIEEQKLVVDEAYNQLDIKNNEILDSINYAERIQRSFLATESVLKTNLPDHFVFFKPKAVVSGDFYWAGTLKNGEFAIVNADSTGHGVPGAIMSILNISSIESAIKEGLTAPNKIFNRTRQLIVERLIKDGSKDGGKDGMDASIICFNFTMNTFTYTAAQNPIWIVRDGNLTEIAPEKMPVGRHDKDQVSFIGGEFKMQTGDQIYTLTDGFSDQFGGPKGKKFMIKKMRTYILSISHLSMEEQNVKLESTFQNWKGNLEQVDDVCVIGIKI